MAKAQLVMLAQWEQEKEDKAAMDYQKAMLFVNQNRTKLQGLENYRLEYFRQIQKKGRETGLEARSFNQHQGFISKLDRACEQQRQVIHNAVLAAEQRKSLWLKQQQKRKAIEMLLDKKKQIAMAKEARIEQAMMDEIALQKFIRKAR
ncbi:flagellar export protein FliJ [Paraneptunicella aestuarii]|uniref:flagellar export protein FliJ n=1 Tax=Paraneptunicella aestuarii TaxID=2831148 RepID=UPI001E46DC5F|nr:flagellar export protein FliJ [Paraneptunicella aestuarii]UAA38165.1 flagellar export protein FliJ [Paraneptunicella aestuarii]